MFRAILFPKFLVRQKFCKAFNFNPMITIQQEIALKETSYKYATSCKMMSFYKNDFIESKTDNVKYQTNKVEKKYFADEVLTLAQSIQAPSTEEWDLIIKDLKSKYTSINEINFSGILIQNFLTTNNMTAADSLISYLKNTGREPNFVTLAIYMAICGKNGKNEELILETYDKLCKLSRVFDTTVTGFIVQGLCGTSKWKEALNVIENLEKLTKAPNEALCCVAEAAFRNKNMVYGWKIIEEISNRNAFPSDEVLKEYIGNMDQNDVNLFMELMNYLKKENAIVSEEIAKLATSFITSYDNTLKMNFTKLTPDGICRNCQSQMENLEISPANFSLLRNTIMDKILKGSDVFINTLPRELENFKKFIMLSKPYDIVIDGLNTAHMQQNQNKRNLALQLLTVIEELNRRNMKVVVLGRKHMYRWPKDLMNEIRDKACCFFTENLSKDDPFIIYSTLAGGPNTLFLSRDLFRDHAFRLTDPNLNVLFNQWKLTHQVLLQFMDKNNTPIFQFPLKHAIRIQGSWQDGWHIPYIDTDKQTPYDIDNKWICIRR